MEPIGIGHELFMKTKSIQRSSWFIVSKRNQDCLCVFDDKRHIYFAFDNSQNVSCTVYKVVISAFYNCKWVAPTWIRPETVRNENLFFPN